MLDITQLKPKDYSYIYNIANTNIEYLANIFPIFILIENWYEFVSIGTAIKLVNYKSPYLAIFEKYYNAEIYVSKILHLKHLNNEHIHLLSKLDFILDNQIISSVKDGLSISKEQYMQLYMEESITFDFIHEYSISKEDVLEYAIATNQLNLMMDAYWYNTIKHLITIDNIQLMYKNIENILVNLLDYQTHENSDVYNMIYDTYFKFNILPNTLVKNIHLYKNKKTDEIVIGVIKNLTYDNDIYGISKTTDEQLVRHNSGSEKWSEAYPKTQYKKIS